jgi:phosphomethylpyrimidine synthase
MTQLERARKKEITSQMEIVAKKEGLEPEFIRQGVENGTIVIPCNINHKNLIPTGIGKGLSTKVNANIGTSDAFPDIDKELDKLRAAIKAGTDTIMDLSTGGDINLSRKKIIEASNVAIGTVPVYQAMIESYNRYNNMVDLTADELFSIIEEQAKDGVDFITVHCGVTLETIDRLKNEGRLTDIVSRGGAYMTGWILYNNKENPLYQQYDRLLDIARKYDVTLSLGDGLRPGCLSDATDRAQVQELIILGELVKRAWDAGVQVMVEGPGHVPLNQIETNIKLQKRLCHGAPFYVLGPLVTDIAPGYDHITAAIGGSIAAASGADFLCYVTPAEHLGLPDIDDVREGVIASKIAAHAADIVKDVKGSWQKNEEMARARKALDWDRQIQLSLDPIKAERMRKAKNTSQEAACTMCGKYCAMKVVADYLGTSIEGC